MCGVFLVTQSRVHHQPQNLNAGRGPYLFPFDAYRIFRGLTTVPGEVDEGSLVPFKRRSTPVFPLCRSLYNSLETLLVLRGGRAHDLSSVVIDKSDSPTVLVDLLLNKICIEEEKQDRRQGGALWQPGLFKFSHFGCLTTHYNRGRTSGAEGVNPAYQIRWDASSR
jgi:hypothetical protein